MKRNILIIEDDQTVNDLLLKNLTNLNYQVESALDGEEGLLMALEYDYQIILLDVMIPKLDGFRVLERLRTKKTTPVLFLTAKGAEEDRIYGFKTGADDYLIKPFSMAELELRIEAILRRTQSLNNTGQSKIESDIYNLGTSSMNIHFNEIDRNVIIRNQNIPFTPIEFDLLYTLVKDQGEVLSKAHLYQSVLLREFSRYDRTLDMHISKIRKKITAAGMSVNTIKTVSGQGYCFDK
ncbi:MAG: two-component system response regulator PfeR [Oleispira sp.]|jgi:two-component system response regulator PfeR